MKFKTTLIIFFVFAFGNLFSSDSDSLVTVLCNEKSDSVRLTMIYSELVKSNENGDIRNLLNKSSEIIKGSALCGYKLTAHFYYFLAEKCYVGQYYNESINMYQKAGKIYKEKNQKFMAAICGAQEGYLNYVVGNFDKAAEILSENEKYCLINKVDSVLDRTYLGLGFVYRDLNAWGKSLEFFNKSLDEARKANHYVYIYTALNEIGNVYTLSGDNEKALSYHLQSIAIKEEQHDTISLCYSYNDISLDYISIGNYKKALEYLFKSVDICKRHNLSYILIANYLNISDIYLKINKVDEAEAYLNQAKEFAEKLNVKNEQASVYYKISDVKAMAGDYKNAYLYYKLFKTYSDSVMNESVVNKLNELAAQYEFEKNKKEIDLLNKDKELKESELNRQVIFKNSLIIGIILLVLLLGVFINRFLIKRKANIALFQKNEEIIQQKEEILSQRDEIEAQRDKLVVLNEEIVSQRDFVIKQRDEITQINKEIKDSINYARQIQSAMLPFHAVLSDYGIDYFIFFQPRDVVSGDFYWFVSKDEKLVTMVADCTGHGVPGAFMSILGISALNEIINKFEILPEVLLNELRNLVIKTLHQGNLANDSNLQDGMDVTLAIINKREHTVEFAGANNPLYVIRKQDVVLEIENDSQNRIIKHSEKDNVQFIELKPDKWPIGVFGENLNPFKSISFRYCENDLLYMFSDGFTDQFGGVKNKKFKANQFRKLLSEVHFMEMSEQKNTIEKKYIEWKGDNNQVDDILIMGLKL